MEYDFHNWLKQQCTDRPDSVHVGIGDDGAVISSFGEDFVVVTDTIAEGTHFELESASLELVGRKSLAVNLSDLAAMGATPFSAVLTFLLPKHFQLEQAQALFNGIQNLASQFNVAIIGGDTNRWAGPLVVGATALGRRESDFKGWSLDGAKSGDAIVVSGAFGGSIHGHHLSFTPRVDLAIHLANNFTINAATDATDSLAIDLSAIATASQLGVDLDLETIPISTAVKETDVAKRIQHALTDGEDFELILAVPQKEIASLLADPEIEETLVVIGAFSDQHSRIMGSDDAGQVHVIAPSGYIH